MNVMDKNFNIVLFTMILSLSLQFSTVYAKKYDVVIERVAVYEVNQLYLQDFSMYTRRVNRTAPYSLMGNFTVIYPLNNNTTMTITCYEKMNAGYKLSPLQFKFGLCDWMIKDKLVIPVISKFTPAESKIFSKCPLQGLVLLQDLIVTSEDAPTGFWPFMNTRLDINANKASNNVTLLSMSFFMKVVERPEKRVSNRG